MPTLKEVRKRIASVKSTRKVTSAMKMIAASRLRVVQNYILHLRHYETSLKGILDDMMETMPDTARNIFLAKRDNRDVLVVAVGSNRGMCGAYNSMVIKYALDQADKLKEEGYRVKIMAIGKKVSNFFAKREYEVVASDYECIDKISPEKIFDFSETMRNIYLKHHLSGVVMVYHRFKNAAVQDLHAERVLPLVKEQLSDASPDPDKMPGPEEKLILEPSPAEVLEYMAARYVQFHFFRILLDAAASEHGSRMTAMHKATDNADELMDSLSLAYNKARQANITKELMDIMGGAGGRSH